MKVVLLLAYRYLFSKKSNNVINLISWISIIAIAFTTAAFIIILSVMNGFSDVVGNLYNSIEPDLKISLARGKYFKDDDVMQKIIKHPNILKVSKVISNQALMKYQQKQVLVTVKGVDENFSEVTKVQSVVHKGMFTLQEDNFNYLVIGQGIANTMDIHLHNRFRPVILYSPKRMKNTSISTDVINEKAAYVSGIFSINDDFDYKYVFCSLKFAQDLFDTKNLISSIDIALRDASQIEVTQKELQNMLGDKFVVKNRYQLNEVLFKTLQTEKIWTFIILSFILLIATFSIISALTMLIIEKQKDIQTLYALGLDKKRIEGVFMMEGFLITFGGAFVGLVMGLIVCWIQLQFHIISFNENSILPYYPVKIQAEDFYWVMLVLLTIGFFAAIYPVRFFTREIKWQRST